MINWEAAQFVWMAVSGLATLGSFVVMLQVRLAIANLKTQIERYRAEDLREMRDWVEEHFVRKSG